MHLPASRPWCKWLGLILGLNTWPVPSHPLKTGLVFERPNVCGLAANISTCRMRWKSNVVSGGCIDWSLLWCRRAVSQGLYSVCVICVLLLISRWCISWCWSLSDTSTQTIILWRNFTLIVLQACCKSNTFPPELVDCLAPTLPIAWMWTKTKKNVNPYPLYSVLSFRRLLLYNDMQILWILESSITSAEL